MLPKLAFDIGSLHWEYAKGLRPERVIDECLRRIEACGDDGIFLFIRNRESLLAEAASLGDYDPAKSLWGMPFAVKDNIDVAGVPTTAACPDFAYVAEADAFVVAKLREAGALCIGKTNMDQFATGLVGVRTPYRVPRNALDPDIVPGGSSSGSAIAVARGLVSFSLGTDTAGSGRVPAALNGIVGLKPSLGLLSNSGVVPACRTLDTVSVFALTVADAYCAFSTAAVYDPHDPYARQSRVLSALGSPSPHIRIGVPDMASREFFGDAVQAASYTADLEHLAHLGAEITELDFTPFFQIARRLYQGAWVAERYTVIASLLKEKPAGLLPVLREIVAPAVHLSAADAFLDFYHLQTVRRTLEPLLAQFDCLCVPSVPTFCTLAEVEAEPIEANARLGIYTNFVNLLDLCGLTIPTTPRHDGRPGSITLLASRERDAQLAAWGNRMQQACCAPLGATNWPLPRSNPSGGQVMPDEIELAVVGAHMSGLPLNHELTRLGSRFLYTSRTSPNYRLFRLPGGLPMRPGVVRSATGSRISLEVWALPADRLGEFIRGVPSPLSIGTLTLEDGAQVKGFLCESIALDGAEEVTRYGGWRAYLDARSFNEGGGTSGLTLRQRNA